MRGQPRAVVLPTFLGFAGTLFRIATAVRADHGPERLRKRRWISYPFGRDVDIERVTIIDNALDEYFPDT